MWFYILAPSNNTFKQQWQLSVDEEDEGNHPPLRQARRARAQREAREADEASIARRAVMKEAGDTESIIKWPSTGH